MVWDEETIRHLRDLWAQGLSTAEIGRRLNVSKNAIVGKAHRLDLDARPSPIRREAAKPAPERSPGCMRMAGPTLPPLASASAPPMVAGPDVQPVFATPDQRFDASAYADQTRGEIGFGHRFDHSAGPRFGSTFGSNRPGGSQTGQTLSDRRFDSGSCHAETLSEQRFDNASCHSETLAGATQLGGMANNADRRAETPTGSGQTTQTLIGEGGLTGAAPVIGLRPLAAAPVAMLAPRSVMPSRPIQARRPVASCCWPIGEPGTKTFRFCDDAAMPGKPYCDGHAKLAYVKIRDRKEDAA